MLGHVEHRFFLAFLLALLSVREVDDIAKHFGFHVCPCVNLVFQIAEEKIQSSRENAHIFARTVYRVGLEQPENVKYMHHRSALHASSVSKYLFGVDKCREGSPKSPGAGCIKGV